LQQDTKGLLLKVTNLVIINALKDLASIPWQITNVIEDVRFWLSHDVQFEINYIYREANTAMD